MKFGTWIHRLALVASLATVVACDKANSGLSSGSPTTPSPSVNLAGSWSGKLAVENESDKTTAKWTASQNGTSVTGPFELTFLDDNQTSTIQGTLSGTLSGAQLSLTISFPAGTFREAPACSISGTGTATPTSSSISSTVTFNFAAPCIGKVGERATETDQLTLSKS